MCCPRVSACREEAMGGEDAGPANRTQTSAFLPRALPSPGLYAPSPLSASFVCVWLPGMWPCAEQVAPRPHMSTPTPWRKKPRLRGQGLWPQSQSQRAAAKVQQQSPGRAPTPSSSASPQEHSHLPQPISAPSCLSITPSEPVVVPSCPLGG